MQILDNLKQLLEKRNRLYLILVIWLIFGIVIIDFLPIVGIIIFIPYLAFLIFLYLVSIVFKKDIRDFSKLSLIGLILISLPLMLIIIVILFILFPFSLISYLFMTSWFILYGILLLSKRADKALKQHKAKKLTRGIEFFGGISVAITLLFLFYLAPMLDVQKMIFEAKFPIYLNYAYLIIGIAILSLAVICLIYMFKKSFNAWFGLFSIIIAGYTFFLVLKIFLGITSLESTSSTDLVTEIGLLIADILIIVYAISTLMGTHAELLAKQLKYFGIDTIFIWLLFSKASYEFVANFPYEILLDFSENIAAGSSTVVPILRLIDFLNYDVITLAKNIVILVFFILLLGLIGLWEIRKYNRTNDTLLDEPIEELSIQEKEADKVSVNDQNNSENLKDVENPSENADDFKDTT